jgi:hypothetical protein
VQSFPIVAKPTLLARSQLVRRRLDLGEEKLVVTKYNQIWPSRTAPPVVGQMTRYRQPHSSHYQRFAFRCTLRSQKRLTMIRRGRSQSIDVGLERVGALSVANEESVMDDPVQEIVEVLRSNPSLLNALLFDPEAIASHLKSREAKALVYGVDPKAFIQALSRPRPQDIGPGCGVTCGTASCFGTCHGSCDDTCLSSCGETCMRGSCGHTTDMQAQYKVRRPPNNATDRQS